MRPLGHQKTYYAILYVDEGNPCNELKEKLNNSKILFREWSVDPSMVDFTLPMLYSGSGVYTGKELLGLESELPILLNSHRIFS